jgi:hypothetical protein
LTVPIISGTIKTLTKANSMSELPLRREFGNLNLDGLRVNRILPPSSNRGASGALFPAPAFA